MVIYLVWFDIVLVLSLFDFGNNIFYIILIYSLALWSFVLIYFYIYNSLFNIIFLTIFSKLFFISYFCLFTSTLSELSCLFILGLFVLYCSKSLCLNSVLFYSYYIYSLVFLICAYSFSFSFNFVLIYCISFYLFCLVRHSLFFFYLMGFPSSSVNIFFIFFILTFLSKFMSLFMLLIFLLAYLRFTLNSYSVLFI